LTSAAFSQRTASGEVPEKEQESLLLTHGDHYLDGKV
jgi:hypothetical protein